MSAITQPQQAIALHEIALQTVLRQRISIRDVLRIVALYEQLRGSTVTYSDLIGQGRLYRIVRPRHAAFYLARYELKRSLPDIAKYCGGCDHTSVIHGIQGVAKRLNAGDRATNNRITWSTQKMVELRELRSRLFGDAPSLAA